MNRRSGILSRTNIPIELTSLLDVIFLILFVVMLANKLTAATMVQESTQLAEEAQAELIRTRSELETARRDLFTVQNDLSTYEGRVDMYEHSDVYAALVNVYVTYSHDNIREREIHVSGPGLEPEPIKFNSNTENAAWSRLEKYLSDYAEQKAEENIPVIVSYNREDILNRDEIKLSGIIHSLQKDYANLYNK